MSALPKLEDFAIGILSGELVFDICLCCLLSMCCRFVIVAVLRVLCLFLDATVKLKREQLIGDLCGVLLKCVHFRGAL